ncbi:transport system permease protein (plasmid) [Gloeothece citriformis PCC 7424]|uniref:Transport system permease protein n=1 Tax=Gloeothece citriformis (strain PCC 7424) TaxID=65393 RepID=B7KLZ1_GLOC7|nr:iron ABC transporter permease [Gloeothece citriformis]ACK73813.1 transport system permease protein [Gloeothece citriformis PCC 7424]
MLSQKLANGRNFQLFSGLLSIGLILILSFVLSLVYGATDISFEEVVRSLIAFDGSTEHLIVRGLRLPRSLIAVLVGAALAVAGALIQGLTGNPLASPGILGINAGAAFAVVASTFIFGNYQTETLIWVGFGGAAMSAIAVYGLSSLGRGGLNSLNLIIAGAAITAFLSSLTSGILVVSQQTLDDIRFWLAGSIAAKDLFLFKQVLPYLLVGLILAMAMGRQLTLLNLGEDTAKSLGQRTVLIKGLVGICITLLAGASVALAGPISFIGLIVPHLARFWVGIDYRWILPYSALLGAIILLNADCLSRVLLQPRELPVGLVMPLLGAPFFLYLTSSKVK